MADVVSNQKTVARARDLVGENDQAVRALAHLVAALRPEWPETSVLTILRKDRRPLSVVANVAVHVAADPKVQTPGVIATRAACGGNGASEDTHRPEIPKWDADAFNRAVAERCTDWAEHAYAARASIRSEMRSS